MRARENLNNWLAMSVFLLGLASNANAQIIANSTEDFETNDFSKFPWSSSGEQSWDTTRSERHSGFFSARSGSIEDFESTTLQVSIDCVFGDITFYCKVSSEPRHDNLKFKIDGVEKGVWSGEEDWSEVSFPVDEGIRTFEWTYSKDGSESEGDDTAWIDDIVFPIKSNSEPIDEIPDGWYFIEAGELRVTLEDTGQGFRLMSLFDLATGTEFMGQRGQTDYQLQTEFQLFRIYIENTEGDEWVELRDESGWNQARIDSTDDRSWLITFESPTDPRFTGTTVTLPIHVEAISNAIHFDLRVQGVPEPWAVKEVKFPRLKLAHRGPQTRVLIPQGCGRVLKESFAYFGMYPGGTASMPYLAFYDSQGSAGLYVGTHDPWASSRNIGIGDLGPDGIPLMYAYPAPNSDQPGNGFDFPGEAVLQIFRGDWYDATLIYRDWVHANAMWYPELSENGREDTALWMRELPVWIRSWNHATIADDVRWAKQFADFVGVPTGLRWYGWHQDPFDNDLPHFFPAKPGFREAIYELQGRRRVPIYAMPYINGLYWDTRDRGMQDFPFTDVALDGTVKNEQGEPLIYVQEAGRQQPAVMCPTSEIWKETRQELVLRLASEFGAKAIYMDCIGDASSPCFDHSHDHPTGEGSWWARSYWTLVEDIRRVMPPDCILTTESSCEAYVHVFDGFLGKWDMDGAVPAFPTIYGRAIQVFGQFFSFAERPTKTLAHRMQVGQAFVFGEQLGGGLRLPAILDGDWEESLRFLTQIALLRWHLRRFFYAGEMARPPKLYGSIPTVTADWGNLVNPDPNTWVTTDAVLTGAWKIPHEQRLVLLFVNVSDRPVTGTLDFDAERYGLPTGKLTGTVVVSPAADQSWGRYSLPSIPGEPSPIASKFQRVLRFPERLAWAWIIEP